MRDRRLMALFIACYSFADIAAGTEVRLQTPSVLSFDNVLHWLAALIAVLALFGILTWLLKKSGHLAMQRKSELVALTALSLGMREKLVLVKVGEKQLLLGVTPGRVDKLMVLEGDERLFQHQDEANDVSPFSMQLQQLLQRKNET